MTDEVQIGRLIQAVDTLAGEVKDLKTDVEAIQASINKGKGFAVGLFLAAGSVGAGISQAFNKLFGGS